MFRKSVVLKISENPKKKLFSRDPLKQFELSNLSSFYAEFLFSKLKAYKLQSSALQGLFCFCC